MSKVKTDELLGALVRIDTLREQARAEFMTSVSHRRGYVIGPWGKSGYQHRVFVELEPLIRGSVPERKLLHGRVLVHPIIKVRHDA